MSRYHTNFRAKKQPDGKWWLEATEGMYAGGSSGSWGNIPTLEDVQRTVLEYGANTIEWTYFNDDGTIREVKVEQDLESSQ